LELVEVDPPEFDPALPQAASAPDSNRHASSKEIDRFLMTLCTGRGYKARFALARGPHYAA
jgi:hypothetical protein